LEIQSFSYVILVAILGMGIVFVFLWFLSGLMTFLRSSLGRTRNEPGPSAAGAAGSIGTAKSGVPGWIIAAVVAFTELESSEAAPVASPWVAPGRRPGQGETKGVTV